MLDTSALLYWTLDPQRLSRKAKRAIADSTSRGVCVSAISLWEIGIKTRRGTLTLGVSFDEYVQRVQRVKELEILAVDVRVWLHVGDMPWDHRDPADRVIVATAELRRASLVTSDANVRDYYERAVW